MKGDELRAIKQNLSPLSENTRAVPRRSARLAKSISFSDDIEYILEGQQRCYKCILRPTTLTIPEGTRMSRPMITTTGPASYDCFDAPRLPSGGFSIDNSPQDAYQGGPRYNPRYPTGGSEYRMGYGRDQAHPEDICWKSYHRPTASVPSRRVPYCHSAFRNRGHAFHTIHNFERLKFGQKARVSRRIRTWRRTC